ncbi:MAG: methionyl-tRNA formyltransferase [Prevotellaceae bacterium]|jgi:methionyl-tRNA formyltransferase|nr:methionyl-tRNA formyltransferase [Prevotellaceae bacterium]
MSLKIVYMGTPEFAVAPLKALLDGGYTIAGVVTAPDRPAGRGQRIQMSAVKAFALSNGLPLAQPEQLRDEEFLQQLRAWDADVFVVVAFRMLPEEVFTIPPKGTFNLHASLLPQYRGAAPINRALMNGERQTGVTTFFIDKKMDTGQIIFREATDISADENAGQLHDRLMQMGAALVVKTIEAIAGGEVHPVSQSAVLKDRVKDAPKITKETRIIQWQQSPKTIYDQIRGLSPRPAAISELWHASGTPFALVKIISAKMEIATHSLNPGTLHIEGNVLRVACNNGFILITELQLAGKKAMSAAQFIAGFRHLGHYRFYVQKD